MLSTNIQDSSINFDEVASCIESMLSVSSDEEQTSGDEFQELVHNGTQLPIQRLLTFEDSKAEEDIDDVNKHGKDTTPLLIQTQNIVVSQNAKASALV